MALTVYVDLFHMSSSIGGAGVSRLCTNFEPKNLGGLIEWEKSIKNCLRNATQLARDVCSLKLMPFD